MERRILSLEEIEMFQEGTPITPENRIYVNEEVSKRNMFLWHQEEGPGYFLPYVKFTSQGFIQAKRKQFSYEHGLFAGIRKVIGTIREYKIK